MLLRILGFEVRYQLRSALFLVGYVIFLLLAFGSTASDRLQFGGLGSNVFVNAPFAIVLKAATLNLFGLFVFTAFMANVVIRDDETGLAPIIRSTRITKLDYLLGRFLGAYLVALLVMTSVPVGILIGSLWPTLDPEKVTALVVTPYLHAMAVYVAPTVLAFGAAFFAIATVTRSMMWTYVGVLGSLVAYVVTQTLLSDPSYANLAAMIDPFGVNALLEATRYWTVSERNIRLPELSGLLLYNRLLWVGVAAALFGIAYAIFRFEARGARAQSKPGETQVVEAPPAGKRLAASASPGVGWLQLWTLTRFDTRYLLKSPAFFVLLAIGMLLILLALQPITEFDGVESLPVTRTIISAALPVFLLFPLIIAIYYSGELVWRDRDQRIHEIVDATSAPSWSFMIPKVIAIVTVLLISYLVAVATAILFQLYHGYTRLDLSAYLLWFVLPNFIRAMTLAALAVFVQALVPHKFFGWAVMLLYIVALNSFDSFGLEHNLYIYNGAPRVPLSDMNDMGRFWVGRAWFQLYWAAVAMMMLVIAHLLWRRGANTPLRARLATLPRRLLSPAGALFAASALLAIGVGSFIFYNTNVLNDYRTTQQVERLTADAEKKLLAYENLPQPHIIDVKLSVDLHPKEVRARTEGVYTIENRSNAPLAAVHVRWTHGLQMQQLDVEGARLGQEFPEFEYRIYEFATPMQPGERRLIKFTTLLQERGFPNDDPLTRIVGNGTFLDNTSIAPTLGMDRGILLRDRSKRRKYGLPADLRPAKLEDQAANAYQYLRHDSDWVTAEIKVTTDADQTPIAPGYTVSDTVTGNRRTLVTRTDSPIMHFFSIQSARYAVKKDTWTGPNGTPVDLAVYYHPEHEYNVARMLSTMKTSLVMFSEKFGPYQFRQSRILEYPAYESFAQAFANTVPYSEIIGFTQNYHEARSDETVDRVSYVTAHEIGHQWWAHQLIGADKQGMTLLSESFAQYSALLVMEKLYGREQIRKFLKGELDGYLNSRGSEAVEELPLGRVENQQYIHYQKGSLAMYWLREVIGEETVNRALQKLLAEFAFKPAPYASSTDFLRLLRAEAGPEHDELITDLFEKITLYDMKASKATARRQDDGKYQVSFTVTARKLYADGEGRETEAPLAEGFDVGAFTAEPGKKGYRSKSVLLMERQPMHSGQQTITLLTDELPKFVGVDPYNKRIDRNSDDNLTKVTLQ